MVSVKDLQEAVGDWRMHTKVTWHGHNQQKMTDQEDQLECSKEKKRDWLNHAS